MDLHVQQRDVDVNEVAVGELAGQERQFGEGRMSAGEISNDIGFGARALPIFEGAKGVQDISAANNPPKDCEVVVVVMGIEKEVIV